MSSTTYWMPNVPDEPLGSWSQLKYLLFDEGSRHIGETCILSWDSPRRLYLEGLRDGYGADDDRKPDLTAFLDDLRKHGSLKIWIDE